MPSDAVELDNRWPVCQQPGGGRDPCRRIDAGGQVQAVDEELFARASLDPVPAMWLTLLSSTQSLHSYVRDPSHEAEVTGQNLQDSRSRLPDVAANFLREDSGTAPVRCVRTMVIHRM